MLPSVTVIVTALLAVSSAIPAPQNVVPFYQHLPFFRDPFQIPEPEDLSYTRTDVFSSRIAANGPHPMPFGRHVKNTYFSEENFVRGPKGPIHVNGLQFEPRPFDNDINVPASSQIQQRRVGPARPMHPDQEEIPAPVLQPKATVQIYVTEPAPTTTQEPFEIFTNPETVVEPSSTETVVEPTSTETVVEPISTETVVEQSSTTEAPRRPPVKTPFTIGYPLPAAQVTDLRRTYFTPISQPQVVPLVSKLSIVPNSLPWVSGVRTQINHGHGAVSTVYF